MLKLRNIELAGSPAQMGRSHGEQFRDEIHELAEVRLARLADFVKRHAPDRPNGREDILAAARGLLDAHREYDAAVWEEFAGIAAGADISLEELLVGNGYTDVRDFVAFGAAGGAEHLGECSSFLVPAGRAEGGKPIIGQTWDMHADAGPYLAIVRRRPADAPETLGLTTTGCLSLIGMNDRGVSIGNNNLIPTDPQPGANYLFTITAALRCNSAGEAARRVESTPRLSGHNFLTADGRDAINVETSARQAVCTDVAGESVFVHTNHYLSDRLASLEAPRDLAGTRWRQRRLSELFGELSGPISMDDCWRLLSDDQRRDGAAVCNEDYDASVATLATVVQCPAERRMLVCAGGARTGRRIELSL